MNASPRPSWPYRFAAATAFGTFRLQGWRFDVAGLEHVPTRGGAVLAMNHTSFVDFFTVGRAPYQELGRPVRILAKASLFRLPLFGRLMRSAGHIPVQRGAGTEALSDAVSALGRGELVGVLPEQTISRAFELLPFKTGAARMAIAAAAPLVPSVSWGSHRFWTVGRPPRPCPRLTVVVRYGEPVVPTRGDDADAVTAELRARMAGLLETAREAHPEGLPAGAWWVPARLGGGAPSLEEAEAELARLRAGWQRRATRRRARRPERARGA
ncbi:MAG: hypothetical protein RLZZ272_1432 [Actinomycetota bacterium]